MTITMPTPGQITYATPNGLLEFFTVTPPEKCSIFKIFLPESSARIFISGGQDA